MAKILEEHNTSLKELGLKGCTLFYRRKTEDMPLYPRKGDSADEVEKAKRVTQKLLKNYQNKYLFHFEELCIPKKFKQKGEKLTGITFQRVNLKDGKLTEIPNEILNFDTQLVISSIGSLPESLPSIPYKGDYLRTYGEFGHKVEGFDNVFAIGNVVTGKGNILDSKKHGREITGKILEGHFKEVILKDSMEARYEAYFENIEASVDVSSGKIVGDLEQSEVQPDEKIQRLLKITKGLQEKVGFNGNYQKWVDRWRPERLEDKA